MIKFTAAGRPARVYGLGLSRGNIDALTAGRPIQVNLADMGGPMIEVVILFGETEQALFDDLKAAGMIHEEIEYREVPPGEHQIVRVKST